MMTYEMVMELLTSAGEDLLVGGSASCISVDVDDFEGFDSDWCEIMRDLDNEALVDEIYRTLEQEALEVSGDFYRHFRFDGFEVVWGYTSYDI